MISSHLNSVRNDATYSDILAGWDSRFYEKFTRTIQPDTPGGTVLDIGCGVGQVVERLNRAGFVAHGVDVAEANIRRAQRLCNRCILYDGGRLPFADNTFAATGALNVLEHVEDPELFISEAVRVTRPGGKIVLSSPNFLRFLGFRDYHPRMRGLSSKFRNARGLLRRRSQMRLEPDKVRFERMQPIIKEPFTPDDDAIVATNALDMEFFLTRNRCQVISSECTDRDVNSLIRILLNATPLRYGLFNAFVVALKNG